MSVAGLPSRDYDVYVYADGDNKGYYRTASYAIAGPNITATSVNVVDLPQTNFSGTFTEAAGSSGNYVRFRIKGTAFTVTATPGTSTECERARSHQRHPNRACPSSGHRYQFSRNEHRNDDGDRNRRRRTTDALEQRRGSDTQHAARPCQRHQRIHNGDRHVDGKQRLDDADYGSTWERAADEGYWITSTPV